MDLLKDSRVLLVAGGSRGDTQPVIALAAALKSAGATKAFVEGYGCEFRPLHRNWQETLQRDEGLREAGEKGDINAMSQQFVRIMAEDNARDPPVIHAAALEFKPDLIVASSTQATTALVISEVLKIPSIAMFLQPVLPSKCVPPVMVDPATLVGVPPEAVLAMHEKFTEMFLPMLLPLVNTIAKDVCGWQPKEGEPESLFTAESYLARVRTNNSPLFTSAFSFSRAFLGRTYPTDYPDFAKPDGFLYLPKSENPDDNFVGLSAELQAFIDAGEPPIYIGWGSMCMGLARSKELTRTVVRGVMQAKKRAIILQGWQKLIVADLDPVEDAELVAYAKENIANPKSVAHDAVMPQCGAVLIHCGAGTSAVALRSGRPLLLSPYMFDQPFIAHQLQDLGVGVRVPSMIDLTPESLAESITAVLAEPSYQLCAQEAAATIASEDGLGSILAKVTKALAYRKANKQ